MIVVAVALLLGIQVVRNAAVMALARLHPEIAAKFWAGHPSVEIALGLTQIGRAARDRQSISARTFAIIDDAAVKAPLSPEPFLVRGVRAQTSGKRDEAAAAFRAAQARDPRSLAAAYFLAAYYFRAGRSLEGLEQAVILARLAPGGGNSVAPFVASYARNRSNWPAMRALFRSQEWLEDTVLSVLARDPSNAEAILAVSDADHRKPDSDWLKVLLRSLVASGDYQRARHFWSTIGGGRGGELLYDSDFSSPGPPPPFNWSFASSTIGLAERQAGKRLHVIFYGNVDGVLASELLTLAPGSYRLQMQLTGAAVHPDTLRWSIICDRAQEPISSLGVDQTARHGWTFQVPANCPAQWLKLSGRSGDVAQQAEVTITALTLTNVGGNA